MTPDIDRNGPGVLTGRHVALALVLFFAVVIAVNLTLAWFSARSWTGLVVPNSYVASQNYNARLEAAREQQARGWREKVDYADGWLNLEVYDREGRPVLLDHVCADIGRPAADLQDREIPLDYIGGARYGAAAQLDNGIWQLVILGESGEGDFRIEGRMLVSREGKGRMK
jgi:nitrogen fixation protein FixH